MRYNCCFFHDYTQAYIVSSSRGGQGVQYYTNTTVQLVDLVTGEMLAACRYHEDPHPHESDRQQVIDDQLLPVLRNLVTIYP